MTSSAAVIVELRGPIMLNMHTRPNVLFVAMCMVQMDPTCMKGDVPNVRKVLPGYVTGRLSMAKRKRKLAAAEKAEKKRRQKEYMTIFINGKQKRVKRPPTIDGMDVDEFIRRNADPIWLHQNEMWEYITDDEES